ncbi:hypothetical protein QF002_003423 [Paraburkholderia youngii]
MPIARAPDEDATLRKNGSGDDGVTRRRQRRGRRKEHPNGRCYPTAFRNKPAQRLLMTHRFVQGNQRRPSTRSPRTRITLSSRKRQRLQYSRQFLRDAQRVELSMHSRFRCAFECIYMCLLELAEFAGKRVAGREHPIPEVVGVGTKKLKMPARDSEAIQRLTGWAANTSPFVPNDSIAYILRIAEEVLFRTERLVAGRRVTVCRGATKCAFR